MPAVTVDDLTTLARLPEPGLGDQPRPVWQVTTAPQGYEGEGFPVRRAFAGIDLALLDPFIMMDQMGEVEYAPGEAKGTPWHPHRGFETVTYMIDGVFEHQDSHGGGGTITNGDTQWMTAGSGILHIETPPEWLVQSGGLFHGIQLWVNLPRDEKMVAPKYQDIRSNEVALLTSYDAGALVRVIAGQVGSQAGPGSTHTPMSLVHATIEPGARLDLPWKQDFNALVYVLNGHGTVGTDARPIHTGQSAVLGAGDYLTIAADGTPGEPVAEAGRDRGRRQAHRPGDRVGGTVRDEQQGRGAAGLRGLPEGELRPHPRLTDVSRSLRTFRPVNGNLAPTPMLQHSAYFYGDDNRYKATMGSFLAAGLERSEAVVAVTTAANVELLREHLGEDARSVKFVESTDWLTTPDAALESFSSFTDRKLRGGAPWVRFIAEPIWKTRSEPEVRLWTRFESLLNVLFASSPLTMVCPYDERSSAPEIVTDAHLTHPDIVDDAGSSRNPGYDGPGRIALDP